MNFIKSYKELRDFWFDRNTSHRDIFEDTEQQLFKRSNKISESHYDELQNTTQILKQMILIFK